MSREVDPDEFLRRFARCLTVSQRWRLLQILNVMDSRDRDDESIRRVNAHLEKIGAVQHEGAQLQHNAGIS